MRRVRMAAAAVIVVACGGRQRQLAPIRLQSITSLGADRGDGAIATDPRVSARHPGGFRIVVPAAGAGGVATRPLLYNDHGDFLGTLQGGGAPDQQFQVPLFARIGPADSIWVFDGSQRVLVFSPDRGYARTARLPLTPWDALVLPDGRMLISPADANRPLPLLLLGPDGQLLHELGADDSVAAPLRSPRWLVRDADGSFWSMPMQLRWRLEHWDTSGAAISVLERRPDWFAPYPRVSTPDSNHSPQPTVRGLWIDLAGRLWVLGAAADPRWDLGLSAHRPGSPAAVIADPDKVYDTMLEAIDRRTGRLLASARLDASYPAVIEAGVVLRVHLTPEGWKKADIVKVIFEPEVNTGP